MEKCKYCRKPYKLNNPDFLKMLPTEIQEKLKYIPDCDCLEREKELQDNQLEKERQQECVRGRLKAFRDISIIDEKFIKSTFENADMSTDTMKLSKRYADLFISKGYAPVGLFFHGKVGTGKTFASACISNALTKANKTVMVLSVGLYINQIQREWAEAENDVLKYAKECDLLVIDDLGVEKVSEFIKDKVFMLIDTRYRTEKPVIVTTNLELTNEGLTSKQIEQQLSIESRFGSRVSDRLTEMCQVCAVTGKSRRGTDTEKKFTEFIRGI
ncbi:ATP-binding protein [Fusobacterium varium]|uniref:ATP-binding protein n=1 Tax=Fusobacterium varium TaxID=856 RepID=UPI0022E17DA0|nr:ATP-binding protein [Fusobacterium varium]